MDGIKDGIKDGITDGITDGIIWMDEQIRPSIIDKSTQKENIQLQTVNKNNSQVNNE